MMLISDPLIGPTIHSAIEALSLPPGSHGLDAGCGIGLQGRLLAEAVGPTGHITGVDISPEFLSYGEMLTENAGFADRMSFEEGDVRRLPFDDDTFDWAWSSCCVGYAAAIEPLAAVKEMARVVKSSGSVAILVWSSETLLPGYPRLEARLKATSSGIAPFAVGMRPERHFLRGLGLFREAGLKSPTAHTFAGGAHAPLSADLRHALVALLEMRWPGAQAELVPEDRKEYKRLCLPDSPEFVVNHPDYYAFFTCSMFSGVVAK
jgi:demethylmenaquinone methyltransferase/2-methoxy-6-polyprenyl-1,4-benzoquinol methylase